jgi:hypothetical protein
MIGISLIDSLMMFRSVLRSMRCDRFWNEEFRIVNVEGEGDRAEFH